MAAVSEIQARCVIWLGQPPAHERAALAAAGWQIRCIDPDHPSAIGLRAHDLVVGLVDLRPLPADRQATVLRWLDQHDHLPMLAVVGETTAPPATDWHTIIEACDEHFALPRDWDALIAALQSQPALASDATPNADAAHQLLGSSSPLLALRCALHKFGPVELPVLITGETGTGKELAAQALHALSTRAQRPLLAVNCGAIPPSLVQSELFGHERGAFTGAAQRRLGLFESAHGGTVFLDEVGDLPLDAQTSLLRVLQEGTLERIGSNQPLRVDVRVLAATHIDLEQAVAQGRFRRDLFYRLNVLRLAMPALRDRGHDVVLLAEHFLARFRQIHRGRARGFSDAARQAMQGFTWPGNVRELLNRVQRAAIVAEGELIEPTDLELHTDPLRSPRMQLQDSRHQAERELLEQSLRQHQFNVSACARHMQISRVTVYRLCRKYQLELPALR